MGVSGFFRPAEKNFDENQRPLGTTGAQPTSLEDAGLLDLARRLAPERRPPDDQAALEPDVEPLRTPEAATLATTVALVPVEPSGSAVRARKALRISGFGATPSREPRDGGRAPGGRAGVWTELASTLAAAGAALIGAALVIAVFAPRATPPGAPETQPFIAAGQGPAEAPRPSGETVAVRGDVDAARLGDVAPVKVVGSEARPIGRDADASSAATTLPAPPAPPVDAAPPPPVARAAEAAPHNAPEPLAAPTAGSKVVTAAQPTAPRLHSRAKLSRGLSARPTDAKTAAAPSDAATATLSETHSPTAPSTTAGPEATPAPAAPREPVSFVTHAFGALAGAIGAPAGDPSASKSGDWAIQFAAPKTEAEASAAVARLTAKYAGALNGATIAVQKSQVNGETAYALRVAGLSKAEAEALCARVKGRDCFIANESGAR
ncbi:MAG: SPOR domain-containing protein [Hyphomicrobiales bacterium]|nr:SPOR domain-containing protein [Hyphomicrobiales bacterium]